MANKFLTLGIEKDDVVAIHDEKTAMWLYCTFGLQMCGAWPLHFFFQQKDATDVIYILKQSKCKYLLLHPGENDNFVDIVRKLQFFEGERTLVSNALPSLERNIFTEAPKMPAAYAIVNLIPITRNVPPFVIDPETIAAIFCSSGTTGLPKLVPRTHIDLIRSYSAAMTSIGMKGGDIIFSERTFSWIAGYPLHIFNGMTLVTATQFFELKTTNEHMKSTVRILEKEKCNHAILYSSVIREIMNTKHHMPPIQTIISGGGPIYARDSQIVNMCCHRFVNIYGSTETHAMCANIVHKNETMKDFDTGRPFPGMEMKVIRTDGSSGGNNRYKFKFKFKFKFFIAINF